MKRAVVDQPGLKIIVLGLLISLFIGLTLRSQITPAKIHERLKKLAVDFEQKNKSKKLAIDFTESQLLLSDWGFPFPHLSVKNVKVSSRTSSCADNQIFIESLDFPFSWLKILSFTEDQIDSVRAGLVELRLDNPDQCFAESQAADQQSPGPSEMSKSVPSIAPIAKLSEARDFHLYIDKLKIIDKHNYNLPVSLQNVGVKIILDQDKLRAVDLKSQLFLFRDHESSLYKFKSDLNIYFESDPQSLIKATAQIHGKLIDKNFEINMEYKNDAHKILIQHQIQDLSVKALLALTNKQNIRGQSQLDGITGLSISNKGEGEYDLNARSLNYYKISDILLSSDQSSISVDQVMVHSFKPLKFEPFKILMNEFDLEKLKSIPAFSVIQKSIYAFGNISGAIAVNSETDVSSEGKVSGLQVIFSNRGQRAFQKIDEFFYKADKNSFVINRISLEGQPTEGEIMIQFKPKENQSTNPIRVRAEISKIKFNESVYNIFSMNQTKPTQISLSLLAEDQQLKSKLKFDQLASDFVEVKGLEVGYTAKINSVDGRMHDSIFDLSVKNVKFIRSESIDDSFYGLLEQIEQGSSETGLSDFYFDQVKASYVKKDRGEVVIDAQANYFSKLKNEKNDLRLSGKFTNPARAFFEVHIFDHGKVVQNFSVNANLSQYSFETKK